MGWYAAHALVTFRTEPKLEYIPVWENVFLVQASDFDEALARADALARENYSDAMLGDLTWEGRPATREYLGIRKLLTIGSTLWDRNAAPPGDLDEITHWYFSVDDEASLERLVAGRDVSVELEDLYEEDSHLGDEEVEGSHGTEPRFPASGRETG